jgi:uncharacterized protein (DUF3820 family)
MSQSKTELTIDQAYSWVMPFGKYKGWTLLRISDGDVPYIEWLATNLKGRIKESANLILKDIAWRRSVGFTPKKRTQYER